MECSNLYQKTKSLSKKYNLIDYLETVEKLRNINLSIAFLGEFSSGKSTLLNALIGKKILPAIDKPTTASIVEVIGGDSFKAFIKYEEKEELEEIPISDLSEYILNPAPDLEKVLLEVPENGLMRKGFKFVDTPGIQSLNEIHEDITFGYLPFVDASIVVLDINQGGATASLINFLKEKVLEEDINKFIFVLNKIDTKTPQDIEEAVQTLKKQLQDVIPNPQIVPVSAKLALEGKEGSNIEELKQIIEKNVIFQKKELAEKRFCKELKNKANHLIVNLEELKQSVDFSTEEIDSKIEEINYEIKDLENLQSKIKSEFRRFKNYTRNFVDDVISIEKVESIISAYMEDDKENLSAILKSISEEISHKFSLSFDRLKRTLNRDLQIYGLSESRLSAELISKIDSELEKAKIFGDIFSTGLFAIFGIATLPASAVVAGAGGAVAVKAGKALSTVSKIVKNPLFKGLGKFFKAIDLPGKLIKISVKEAKKEKMREELIKKINMILEKAIQDIEFEIDDYIKHNIIFELENRKRMLSKLSAEKSKKITDTIQKRREIEEDITSLKDLLV